MGHIRHKSVLVAFIGLGSLAQMRLSGTPGSLPHAGLSPAADELAGRRFRPRQHILQYPTANERLPPRTARLYPNAASIPEKCLDREKAECANNQSFGV